MRGSLLCLDLQRGLLLTHSCKAGLQSSRSNDRIAVSNFPPLVYFMKLYTNSIQTKPMSVIVSLHKTCLGQSWQEKSIFQGQREKHSYIHWRGVRFICGIVILNIRLFGTQHIGTINPSRDCCSLGPLCGLQVLTGVN